MKDQAAETAVAAFANKMTYAGGTTAFIGGLSANEIAAFGGLVIALVGLLVQVYYKRRSDRREAEFHEKRLSDLREYREGKQ